MTFYEKVKQEVEGSYTEDKYLYLCSFSSTFFSAWYNLDYHFKIIDDAKTFLVENNIEGIYVHSCTDILFAVDPDKDSFEIRTKTRLDFLNWAIENNLDLV